MPYIKLQSPAKIPLWCLTALVLNPSSPQKSIYNRRYGKKNRGCSFLCTPHRSDDKPYSPCSERLRADCYLQCMYRGLTLHQERGERCDSSVIWFCRYLYLRILFCLDRSRNVHEKQPVRRHAALAPLPVGLCVRDNKALAPNTRPLTPRIPPGSM